ncbi:MAG: glycosyltransferase family 4 protein [Elusimicrobiota bacterium]|nr:glycosyltransferase family 4 protein [Endomicrobiia bacterium]MDW8165032.1 glycosyltransferase family 4 protein [Elusimicrobiota bacterium]
MNIAIFDAARYWSGGAQRVYLCCKGFKERNHTVVLICLSTSRLNKLLKNKIKIFNIHPVFDLDFLAGIKIFYILLKYKIDILDIHSPKFYWLGLFVGKILNKKVFITRNVEYRKKGIKKIINRILYHSCDGIIAVSEKIKKYLKEDFKIKDEKIKVIYDGFIFEKKQPKNIRKKYNISNNEIVLSIIGRIEKNKAQDFAIEILYELIKNGYKAKLFIIGKKEDEDFYEYLINKIKILNLSENVILTGFVSNVDDYIFSSDVILCCSYYEGLPRSIIESLALLKPVVSTDAVDEYEVKKLPSLVKIIKERNPKKFASAILDLKESNVKYINDFLKNFSYSNMIDEYLRFYSR